MSFARRWTRASMVMSLRQPVRRGMAWRMRPTSVRVAVHADVWFMKKKRGLIFKHTLNCQKNLSCHVTGIMDAFSVDVFHSLVVSSRYFNVTVTLRCQRAALSSCAFCTTPLLYHFLLRRCSGWTAPVAGWGCEWTRSAWHRDTPAYPCVMLTPGGCLMKLHHCDS